MGIIYCQKLTIERLHLNQLNCLLHLDGRMETSQNSEYNDNRLSHLRLNDNKFIIYNIITYYPIYHNTNK